LKITWFDNNVNCYVIKIKVRNYKFLKVFTYLKAFSSAVKFKENIYIVWGWYKCSKILENCPKIGDGLTPWIASYACNKPRKQQGQRVSSIFVLLFDLVFLFWNESRLSVLSCPCVWPLCMFMNLENLDVNSMHLGATWPLYFNLLL
jgi:hypothetical protein